jgi:hypothetical protein
MQFFKSMASAVDFVGRRATYRASILGWFWKHLRETDTSRVIMCENNVGSALTDHQC